MRKFSVQRTEIVGRNILSFLILVQFQKLFDDRGRVLDWPKAIVVAVKLAFCMEVTNLVEDMFINRRC